MELAPSTVRAHRSATKLAAQLAEKDLRWAIVTTPEGRLLGVAWRVDLERASGGGSSSSGGGGGGGGES